jgi:hypothetical protein
MARLNGNGPEIAPRPSSDGKSARKANCKMGLQNELAESAEYSGLYTEYSGRKKAK